MMLDWHNYDLDTGKRLPEAPPARLGSGPHSWTDDKDGWRARAEYLQKSWWYRLFNPLVFPKPNLNPFRWPPPPRPKTKEVQGLQKLVDDLRLYQEHGDKVMIEHTLNGFALLLIQIRENLSAKPPTDRPRINTNRPAQV